MPGPHQSEPAEGPRTDAKDGGPEGAKGTGDGVSSPEPAEGADDTPGRNPGSPAG